MNESQILSLIAESIKRQDESTKRQNESIKRQDDFNRLIVASQAELIREFNLTRNLLETQHKIVVDKLDRISQNLIIVNDVALVQLVGVEPDTKIEIEETVTEVLEHMEEVHYHLDACDSSSPVYYTPPAKFIRQGQKEFSLTQVINSYNSPVDGGSFYLNSTGQEVSEKAYTSTCGNWLSGIFSQMFHRNFKGNYPLRTLNLVDRLVGFWTLERVDYRRMY